MTHNCKKHDLCMASVNDYLESMREGDWEDWQEVDGPPGTCVMDCDSDEDD